MNDINKWFSKSVFRLFQIHTISYSCVVCCQTHNAFPGWMLLLNWRGERFSANYFVLAHFVGTTRKNINPKKIYNFFFKWKTWLDFVLNLCFLIYFFHVDLLPRRPSRNQASLSSLCIHFDFTLYFRRFHFSSVH